ncbi:MAG: uroporphyrinogen decarboxylase [Gemmatimonadetes bacterium]|nr:uroporphyrinogen decarboxylase [Gemmatimonadota bacterium]
MAAAESRFLHACRLRPADATPVWFMRQAGRYMPEYRAMRSRHSLLEICHTPELAAQVTLQPVDALGVDAAILFADILLPLEPMGVEVAFVSGEGPLIRNPVRSRADMAALHTVEARDGLGYILESVRLVRAALAGRVPLIGFAGAPFTLATYLVGGGGAARDAMQAKRLMVADAGTWHALMERLAHVVADYLAAQVEAGADAVQLFDSWVGALSPDDYRQYVFPYSRAVLREVSALGVPVIHFGTGTATLLPLMREAGGTVIGLDWRTPLDVGWRTVGTDVGIQGNLDPSALFAPAPELERRVRAVLARAGGRPGHIFNLGHGILPETPVANVKRVVELVHELTAATALREA